MLKLKNIVKIYDKGANEVKALKGIDVDFRKNEFVSILGPSGCGKTTMMNIVGGLDQYTSGDLIINGSSTKEFSDEDWDNYRNKRIGFVFQSYNLIMHQTVLGNVELALTLSGISPSERRKRAIKVLEDVGIGDQIHKKPNQLSGGQMQRVAIARALVNEPEILLADEPTGALDTETSIQILDLIKEVAKDRLVIMVTHNSDLAHEYSNRVINMLDGKFIDDSNPYKSETKTIKVSKKDKLKKTKEEKQERTSMSFLTALALSFKNLLTKKWRTVMTAIAGSIGIIGVALILAVSSGTNNYVDKVQTDTLSSNPLEVNESRFDFEKIMDQMMSQSKKDKFPTNDEIIAQNAIDFMGAFEKNLITEDYVNYLQENIDPLLYNDIVYSSGLRIDLLAKKEDNKYESITKLNPTNPMGMNQSNIQMLVKEDFVLSQYDMLAGEFPSKSDEIVIIVNEFNMISADLLKALNLIPEEDKIDDEGNVEIRRVNFEKVLNSKLYYAFNDDKYKYNETLNLFTDNKELEDAMELKVTGILRINSQTTMGMLREGIGYTKDLRVETVEKNINSEIITFMLDNQDDLIDPFTGRAYRKVPLSPRTEDDMFEEDFRLLGGTKDINNIKIYAKDFKAKDEIKLLMDEYNEDKTEENKVLYLDIAEIFGNAMNQMVSIITIVLISFTSISLVVSSIMIGIITYVSVLERNKEIGILRSIGARKKDITRVFNAETFIIGLFSGMIGIGTTYLLTIPANIIIKNLSDIDNIASLPILNALILIAITIALTVLAGLIPAIGASKMDPVEALRSE